MRISQLFESDNYSTPDNVVVIFPGRFQPFHKGHYNTYKNLISKFGRDKVFVTTSNKVEPPKSPLGFTDKCRLMNIMGIDADRIVQTENPYRANELTSNLNPSNTVLILAISAKDLDSDKPSIKVGGSNKDGSSNYYQPMPEKLDECTSFSQSAYILKVPTYQFTINGNDITDATDIREMLGNGDDETKKRILLELYGKNWQEAYSILCPNVVSESHDYPLSRPSWETSSRSAEATKLALYGIQDYGDYKSWEDLRINPDDSEDVKNQKMDLRMHALKDPAHPLNPDYIKPADRTWHNYYGRIEARDKESAKRVADSYKRRFPDMFKEGITEMTQPSDFIKEVVPELIHALKIYAEAMKNVSTGNINQMMDAAYLVQRSANGLVKYTEKMYDELESKDSALESKMNHYESMFTDVMEDFGSSDMAAATKTMKQIIDEYYDGQETQETIESAANSAAELYYEMMGTSIEHAAEILEARYITRMTYKNKLKEDASAGATCSGSIAAVPTAFANAISRTRVGGIKPKKAKKK